VPATKHPRHKITEFSGQRLHVILYLSEILLHVLQNVNAQRADELVHPALHRRSYSAYTTGPKSANHGELRLSANPTDNITHLLIELSNGDRAAVDLLLPVIYDELRKLAANYLRRERPDHTLQPTALVHEAYLRLIDQSRVNWQNRAHFFGVAAQIMRRLLVDHARKHNAEKRGQDFQKLSLDENIDRAVERSAELIALDDALKTLATFDAQKARMVELRYFGGLSIEETADVLGVTPTTIKRHWRFAKAWLHGEMQRNS
jgi:RNA polymerase sigma-70 factor, ECF subfamily